MVELSRYPEVVEAAGANLEPHLVANYLRELAAAFHMYYNTHQFLVDDAADPRRAPDARATRRARCSRTASTFWASPLRRACKWQQERDARRRAAAANRGRRGSGSGSVSLLGVGLMLLVLFKDWAPLLRKTEPAAAESGRDRTASERARRRRHGKKEPPKKSYDFYKVLEANEVVIPDAELSEKARAEQQAKNAANRHRPRQRPTWRRARDGIGGRYILQAGSYPDAKGADEIKAKLACSDSGAGAAGHGQRQGLASRRLGPYASASELESRSAR